MPFTVSHAVVALPFVRSPLPYGAVAVGAMTPDLPLFFPTPLTYELTHGFPSLLVTSLPLAVVLYSVWRMLLRPAARTLLPRAIGERLPESWSRASRPSPRGALLVLASLLIGVITHVVWDLFTHPGRAGSEWLPALADRWGPLDGTQWLQYASSLLGLVVLAIAAARYLRGTPPAELRPSPAARRLRAGYWLALLLAAVVGLVVTVARLGLPGTSTDAKLFAFDAGTLAGAIMLVLTAGAAVGVLVLANPTTGSPPGSHR